MIKEVSNPMNRLTYIQDPSVINFVAWMRQKMKGTGNEFHSWVSKSSFAAPCKGQRVAFASIYEAFEKYYWRAIDPASRSVITNYSDTQRLLKRLSEELRLGIDHRDSKKCKAVCLNILEWGGVLNKKSIAKDLKEIIPEPELPKYLASVRAWLHSDPNSESSFEFEIKNNALMLPVDSGTTKIYSLLSDDWIIYDGRVGSALGLLVYKWSKEQCYEIPATLKFPHAHEKHRNPNPKGISIFPKMKNDQSRLQANLHANWLLGSVLDSEEIGRFAELERPNRLRALEAALFMIGYQTIISN